VVELGAFPAVLGALQGKTVDAAAIFEPLLSAAVAQTIAVLLSQKGASGSGETFLWANRAWATTDQAVAFVAALILAQRLLVQKGQLDPTIEPVVEQYTHLSQPQLAHLAVPTFAPNAGLRPEDLDSYQTYFLNAAARPLSYTTALDVRQQVDTTALTNALRVVGQQ